MRNLRTEKEIIAHWKTDIEKPIVSISCITYNHQYYIEDALEGFLSQETDFPFEILIHDDASTDKTADIIREYVVKYPRIIKPIYQIVNQFSQGVAISPSFNYPRAKGEYIAVCEGDDYWISKKKLQLQIKLMQQYPDINISFHPAYQVDDSTLNEKKIFCNYGSKIKKIPIEDVVLGGGGFMPTNSIVMKSLCLRGQLNNWLNNSPVGDRIIQIYGSLEGGALYIPSINSCYRQNVIGSWSSRLDSLESQYKHRKKMILVYSMIVNDRPEIKKYVKKFLFKSNIRFSMGALKALDIKIAAKSLFIAYKNI